MNFPREEPKPATPPADLVNAIGQPFVFAGKNRFDYLVQVETEQQVKELSPDLQRIARIPARGVIVTAPSVTKGIDFVSRFFGPAAGVPEDPVTGSAHCCLGPYWSEILGKKDMIGYQASARGGTVCVRLDGDRVWLGGHAVTVLRGELL